MVVADTAAVLALLDRSDDHHEDVRVLYEADPDGWLLPWAVLPEIDYLVAKTLGGPAHRMWLADVASGAFAVEWGAPGDLPKAQALDIRYAALNLGLVDAVVMAVAERLGADIATLDVRHFGAVTLEHHPRLLPRDAPRRRRTRGRRS